MPREIDVNVSSLVDLKAELLRKQQQKRNLDASAAGRAAKQLYVRGTSRNDPLLVSKPEKELKERDASERKAKIRQLESELRKEEEVLQKTKSSLANKALLYERLSKGDVVQYEDGEDVHFLVNFDQKQKVGDTDDDDELVTYTDEFGRERQCRRSERTKLMAADIKLLKDGREYAADGEEDEEKDAIADEEQQPSTSSQQPIGPVHHSHVARNEPRQYGVAHYEFSQDEERREEQMKALNMLRQKTMESREKSEQLKLKRERMMAARLEKVRKRKQMGADPELEALLREPSDEAGDEQSSQPVDTIPLPGESEAPVTTEQKDERPIFIPPKKMRPWDRGKVTFGQEQWVQKRRGDRNEEFAPPSSYFNQ